MRYAHELIAFLPKFGVFYPEGNIFNQAMKDANLRDDEVSKYDIGSWVKSGLFEMVRKEYVTKQVDISTGIGKLHINKYKYRRYYRLTKSGRAFRSKLRYDLRPGYCNSPICPHKI